MDLPASNAKLKCILVWLKVIIVDSYMSVFHVLIRY